MYDDLPDNIKNYKEQPNKLKYGKAVSSIILESLRSGGTTKKDVFVHAYRTYGINLLDSKDGRNLFGSSLKYLIKIKKVSIENDKLVLIERETNEQSQA